MRVTVQLLQVATEEYLWAENYDYMLSDILAFHSDVSGAIAEHVSEKLLPGRPHRLPAPVHPRRPAAYQAFLKGHHVFKNVTDEGLWKARHYWKKAIREDPHYARAYAGLAESYNMLGVTGLLPALEAAGQAREAAIKALEIDESLGEAHNALGFTRMVEWDWDGAGKEFRRALQLDPNFAAGNPCHYVEYLLAIGRPETAVAELERAQEMQPLSLFLSVILGWTYYGARQYDKAVRQHRRVVEIEPHFGMAHWCLGLDYSQKRKVPDGHRGVSTGQAFRRPSQCPRSDWIHLRHDGRKRKSGTLRARVEAPAAHQLHASVRLCRHLCRAGRDATPHLNGSAERKKPTTLAWSG